MRARALAAAGVFLLAQTACTEALHRVAIEGADRPRCHAPARPMVRLELVFGTSRPGGRPVGQAEWADFLAAQVTPRFPAGLTVLSGFGQWQGSDGSVVSERSKLLIVYHEPDGSTDADIEAIREAYKRRFDQESVMRVESVSCVSF